MNKLENLVELTKLNAVYMTGEPMKGVGPQDVALAIIGAVAAVAGIAYAVYRYFTPDYLEDFEDDFEDEFDDLEDEDDDFFVDEGEH